MSKTSQQLFTPPSDPYLNSSDTEPTINFPTNLVLNPNGNIPITVGQLNVSTIELGNILSVFLHNTLVYEDENRSMGIVTGGFDKVTNSNPVVFAPKIERQDLMIPPPVDGHLRLFFEDYYHKHPDHQKAYKVTLILEYVEAHDEVEKLPADQRQKIYQDFAITGQMFSSVDLQIVGNAISTLTRFATTKAKDEKTVESVLINEQNNGRQNG